MVKIIKKEKVEEFLKQVSESGYEVHAPVDKNGITLFRKIDGSPMLDFENSKKPPKEVFFPQTEKMFDFKIEGMNIIDVEESKEERKPILLSGIRPCDARALTVLDKLFKWDYVDSYYVNRKNNAVIISLACTQQNMPLESCFCSSVGGNPASIDGADMLWTEIGDKYLVESLTEKGNKLLAIGSNLFSEASTEDMNTASEAKKHAEEKIVRKVSIEGVRVALEKIFDDKYWDEVAQRCLGCGICTLVCPTCHCFDINDILSHGKGKRERTWDSCQFPYYSVHASGHNPRPAKKHRQRNRVYHKFLYSDKNLGVIGCVGCGRCIALCPVNIDIIEVIEGAKGVLNND